MTTDTVRGTIPARVKSRGSPEVFTFTARFVVQKPKEPNEIAEHDRGWLDLIARKTAPQKAIA